MIEIGLSCMIYDLDLVLSLMKMESCSFDLLLQVIVQSIVVCWGQVRVEASAELGISCFEEGAELVVPWTSVSSFEHLWG